MKIIKISIKKNFALGFKAAPRRQARLPVGKRGSGLQINCAADSPEGDKL
ncbi:MAG TPA: hypothetical protein PLI34_20285 [Saprospiraceae bacterium]|nr:hypothetical protein [Saprospiraceae bacterium]